jgi:riboflavin kinase/FMN adenylyltransferase
MQSASAMLGRPFEMWGVVGHGEKRGRELGYPTANLRPQTGCVVPAFGIYACFANGRPAVASLGVRPTFEDEGEVLLEVHLLDYEGELYDTELHVAMLSRLRGEERFDSVDELIGQMNRDSAAAAEVCKSHGA